jgi:tetratricopeptide (TPR) repeat protein/uncharacterized membrane protein
VPSTIEIFCCYAREDQPLLDHLTKHLMLLQRQGLVSIWSDTNIDAGDEWEKAIHAHLDTAHIILLLISPDFMASDYCYSTEMQRAMQRHSQGDARVIPILLRHTLWKGAPFADLHMLPKDAKPVASWPDKDEPLYTIAEQISLLVKELQIQHALKEAKQLYHTRRYEGALVLYEQVLVQEPQNVHAYVGKAQTLLALQRYEESLAAFEEAERIDLSITDAAFYQLKASALYQLERYEESLLAYNKALQICQSDDEYPQIRYSAAGVIYEFVSCRKSAICLNKADIFLLLKRYRETLESYDLAIHFEPVVPDLYMFKGDLLFRLRNFDSALEMYEEAIRLQPWDADYYVQKGKLLFEWQHYEEALAAFEQSLAIDPLPQYYEQKGQTLLKLARYEDALATYEQALQVAKEDSPYLHSGKGQALLGLERYEEALAAFTHAIELCAPNNIDPQFYHDQAIAYERLAQRAYAMEKQSQLLWLQKQDEEPFFISSPTTKKSLLNIEKFTLLHTLKEHTDSINCIAISLDGQWLASGSSDQTVKMWELATGEMLWSKRGYATAIYSVAISPDGQILATGSDVIKITEPVTGLVLYTIDAETSIFCMAISPDGQYLVSGNAKNTIEMWDLAAKKELQTLQGHRGRVLSVAISPDGRTLVSGSTDKTVKVWDIITRKVLWNSVIHGDHVRCVAISSDGQAIVSGSDDNTIRIWKLPIGQEIDVSRREPGTLMGHNGSVTSVAISPDGQTIVSGSLDNTIKVWELATGRELWTLRGENARGVTCVAISPDGQKIMNGRSDGTIEIWGVQ